MAPSPRLLDTQQVHYLRRGFTFADHGSTLSLGSIPAGSLVLKPCSGVAITTAFNGSPQTLDVGPSTDTDLWGTDLSLSVTTFVPLDESVNYLVAVDTEVQFVVQASAASAGAGEVIVTYVPDNDQ